MRAIDLASAIRLAGPDSEWASGSAMHWTTSSDDVLARLARRREARRDIAFEPEEADVPACEQQLKPATYRNGLASLVLRECGLDRAFAEMLESNEQAIEPALLHLFR